MEGDESTGRTRTLPYTFEVDQTADKRLLLARHVTISQVFSTIKYERVPSEWFQVPTVFTISHSILDDLKDWIGKYWTVQTRANPSDRDFKTGIVYHIQAALFGILYSERPIDLDAIFFNAEYDPTMSNTPQECISQWTVSPHKDIPEQFSMTPPSASINININETLETEISILDFISTKYYSALYSLHTPLSYFPKIALSRFKVLCSKDSYVAKDHLLPLVLPSELFRERHSGTFGLLGNTEAPSSLNFALEEPFRKKLWDLLPEMAQALRSEVSVGSIDPALERIRNIVSLLKIREAQLQLLLIFELLDYENTDEAALLEAHKKRENRILEAQQTKKKSLVRKKKAKKKVIPTFLGMGVTLDESPNKGLNRQTSSKIQSVDLLVLLDTLIESLTLWDTLEESSKGKKHESSLGFFAYILVPFFNKRLPEVTKYAVEKIKPHERMSTRSRLASSEPPKEQQNAVQQTKSRSTRYQKVHLDPHKNPNLKRSNISLTVDDEKLPAIALKRSKSNLSSKNLQRRQVDMSFPKPDINTDKKKKLKRLRSLYDPPASADSIFGNAKKPSRVVTNELATITATPAKPQVSQISETPSTRPTRARSQEIIATPEDKFVTSAVSSIKSSGKSLSDKLYEVADSESGMRVFDSAFTSPVMLNHVIPSSIERSSKLKTVNSTLIVSSHLKLSTKRKPGEPISVEESPFFHTSLNGSPTSSSQRSGVFGKITRKKR